MLILLFVVYVPVNRFINESIDYFELERVGGLKSHLCKLHDTAIKESGMLDSASESALRK